MDVYIFAETHTHTTCNECPWAEALSELGVDILDISVLLATEPWQVCPFLLLFDYTIFILFIVYLFT